MNVTIVTTGARHEEAGSPVCLLSSIAGSGSLAWSRLGLVPRRLAGEVARVDVAHRKTPIPTC